MNGGKNMQRYVFRIQAERVYATRKQEGRLMEVGWTTELDGNHSGADGMGLAHGVQESGVTFV